jgi:hypothetical protein
MSAVCVSFLLGSVTAGSGDVAKPDLKTIRLIRRVYLDVLGCPPTIQELEWLQVYVSNGYETAVKEVLSRPSNIFIPSVRKLLKEFLLSNQYKSKESVLLSSEERDFIIKYQSGIYDSIEDADKQLVANAIASNEPGQIDPIDYMSECLMSRDTTAEEATRLTKTLKSYPSEEEGYLEVLKELKTFTDFYTK